MQSVFLLFTMTTTFVTFSSRTSALLIAPSTFVGSTTSRKRFLTTRSIRHLPFEGNNNNKLALGCRIRSHVTLSDKLQKWGDDKEEDSVKQRMEETLLSNPIVEVQSAGLVILSSFLVAVGTLESLPPTIMSIAKTGELLISAIFTVEYVLRWKLEGFSPKYVVQPLAVIDLIAILPYLIEIVPLFGLDIPPVFSGSALVNLRLLRVLRLQRVLVDYETFQRFEFALGLRPTDTRPYQLQLARVVISIFTLLSVTAGLIYSTEHVVNDGISDYFTALYFSLTTLTTVGFGDIVPITSAGRWVVGASILVGSAVVPAQAAALVEALFNRQEQKDKDKKLLGDNAGLERQGDLATLVSRLDRLEQKVDETNAKIAESNKRIDRVLALLESKKGD